MFFRAHNLRSDLESLKDEVREIERELFVKNFFRYCPCCEEGERILKADAVSFEKLNNSNVFRDELFVQTFYTTKQAYEMHKEKIKEWEEGVKKFYASK